MSDQNNTRPIPPLPGGGSWNFDDIAWKWISNDPAPEPDAQEPAEQPTATAQTTTEE